MNILDISLKTHKKSDHVAPHKPLLILLALSRLQAGEPRLLLYEELERDLKDLLTRFSKGANPRPQYPFWRLQNDMACELWEIPRASECHPNDSNDVSANELIRLHIKGGFTNDLYEQLKTNPEQASQLAQKILDDYFPQSLHGDIKECIGLSTEWYTQAVKRKRDPRFAKKILELYRYSCAVCQYGARLGHAPIGIEAAHIKWHAYEGPDHETNGLALCTLHHKAFDAGALGLGDDRTIIVSRSLNGAGPLEEVFYRHHGKPILLPNQSGSEPSIDFIRWHRREILKDR
jgi:putative restriction endonuclease